MQFGKSGFNALVVSSLVLLGVLASSQANAGRYRNGAGHSSGGHGAAGHGSAWAGGHGRYAARHTGGRYAAGGGHLQCVPFARSDSGIELQGNASIWWNEAAGTYERGSRPEAGSVLSFTANGRMRMGHVAVVSEVVNARQIEIDHANWRGPGSYGGVNRGVSVVDVSPNNDWTAVRVALGDGRFGSIYPTHGFIYDRPDHGTLVANNAHAAPLVLPDAPPVDLRPWATRSAGAQTADFQTVSVPISFNDEVAEAPADGEFRSTGHYRASARGNRRARMGLHRGEADGHGRHAGRGRLVAEGGVRAPSEHLAPGVRLTGRHHG